MEINHHSLLSMNKACWITFLEENNHYVRLCEVCSRKYVSSVCMSARRRRRTTTTTIHSINNAHVACEVSISKEEKRSWRWKKCIVYVKMWISIKFRFIVCWKCDGCTALSLSLSRAHTFIIFLRISLNVLFKPKNTESNGSSLDNRIA